MRRRTNCLLIWKLPWTGSTRWRRHRASWPLRFATNVLVLLNDYYVLKIKIEVSLYSPRAFLSKFWHVCSILKLLVLYQYICTISEKAGCPSSQIPVPTYLCSLVFKNGDKKFSLTGKRKFAVFKVCFLPLFIMGKRM